MPARVGQVTSFGNKCPDVRGGSTENGTPAQIRDCLGNVNQTCKTGADGTIRGVGVCLDVQGGGTGNGTPAETDVYNGATAQQWQVRARGSALNPRSDLCPDVRGRGRHQRHGCAAPGLPRLSQPDLARARVTRVAAPSTESPSTPRSSPMRRTALLFATALLTAAAALTAPAAEAAEPAPTAGARSAQAAGPSDKCYVRDTPQGSYTGTCSGIDPMQTWHVVITCWIYSQGSWQPMIWPGTTSGWVSGNTTYASCGSDRMNSVEIQFGPAPAGGTTGQITGFMNKCLDVRMGTSADGTPVQMYDCLGNVNQSWRIASDGTIRAVGLCLDPDSGRTDNGTPVHIWRCNGAISQQWRVRADGGVIKGKYGRAPEVRGRETAQGARAQSWEFN
ncbi:Ricin B lectin, partial [Actinobacteria bacterium OV450]